MPPRASLIPWWMKSRRSLKSSGKSGPCSRNGVKNTAHSRLSETWRSASISRSSRWHRSRQAFTAGPAQASFPGGKDGVKQAGFQHQFEEGGGRGAAEVLEQLIPHPGRGAGADQVALGQDLSPGRGLDGEADAGRMAQHPQHTHRVAYEAHRRVADHPDDPAFRSSMPPT